MSAHHLVAAMLVAAFLSGCASATEPPDAVDTTVSASTPAGATTSPSPGPTPTGPSVGTATMKVLSMAGDAAPVTIRYRINGAAEQTETEVTLPWEKDYDVFEHLESSVSVTGGGELTCMIMFGDLMVSYLTEPNPTCTFAYWE